MITITNQIRDIGL